MNGKPGVLSMTERAQLDCEELREIAAWVDTLGKRDNGKFLRDVATRYEVVSGAYSTAARRVIEHDEARATVERLAEAAQFVLDKEWEYGDDQPACARLNAALADFRGEA